MEYRYHKNHVAGILLVLEWGYNGISMNKIQISGYHGD